MAFHFTTFTTVADARAAIEALPRIGAVAPYAYLEWAQAWCEAYSGDHDRQFLGILIHEDDDACVFIALERVKMCGFVCAQLIGESHANYYMPIALHPFEWSASAIEELQFVLRQCARQHGIDVFDCERQLLEYAGAVNPLPKLAGFCTYEDLLYTPLTPDFQALVQITRVGSGAKRDRKQMAAISKLGEWQCFEATTPQDRALILRRFYEMKPQRLARKGIASTFDNVEIQSFIRNLEMTHRDDRSPYVRLFGLSLNGEVIAVTSSLSGTHHNAGMFNAIDPRFENVIHPGLVLLRHEIEMYCKSGVHMFDLGAGDARYKHTWLKYSMPMCSILVPVSLKGLAFAVATHVKRSLKHRIKASKTLWQLAQKLRALKGKLGNRGLSSGVDD